MRKNILKRFVLVLAVLSLVFALIPATSFAQEGDDTHSDTSAQTEEHGAADDTHGDEGLAAEHAEEAGGLARLGINLGFLLGQMINILALFAILGAVLWRPAVNMLNKRSADIEKGLEDAAAAARERQNAEAEAEKILSAARVERQKLMEEARAQGDEVRKGIETEARQTAERIRNDANTEAEALKANALDGLRDDVLRISTAVASRVLGENIDTNSNRDLVNNFFTQLPDEAKNLSGAIEVVSAMPLSDDEKRTLESAVNGDSYDYVVDPAILGGLIVRSQDRVVDGSVRNSLNDVSGHLK